MAISPSLMRPYPGKAVGRTMQLDPVWILYPFVLAHRRLSFRRIINRVAPLRSDFPKNLCLLFDLVDHWFGAIGLR